MTKSEYKSAVIDEIKNLIAISGTCEQGAEEQADKTGTAYWAGAQGVLARLEEKIKAIDF